MENLNDTNYLIFALREQNDSDNEADFTLDDKLYLVEAVSEATYSDLLEKEEEMETKFPNCRILTTHLPLFNLIETLIKKRKLEAQVIADGLPLIHPPSTGRIAEAFNWDQKLDTARQQGRC